MLSVTVFNSIQQIDSTPELGFCILCLIDFRISQNIMFISAYLHI